MVNLLVMTLVWTVSSFNFYLLSFQVKYFPGNFNVNMLILNISDCLAYGISGYLFTKFRAKVLFLVLFILASLASVGIVFSGASDFTFCIFVMVARLSISGAFNLVYVAHPKMFPTLFSVTSIGFTNIVTRIFTFFAPLLAEVSGPAPMIVFMVLSALSAMAVPLLYEAHQ